MKKMWIVSSVVTLAFTQIAVAAALAPLPEATASLSKSEVQRLEQTAHTPVEYRTLSDYYDQQQKFYAAKAGVEKLEWQRRSQITTSIAAKYPRPVDSARYRYEYFSAQAAEMQKRSDAYRQRAESTRM